MNNGEEWMSAGGWSCPHEVNDLCSKVNGLPCDPGMKGCELYGRYAFFDGSKNERLKQKQARTPLATPDDGEGSGAEAFLETDAPGLASKPPGPGKE
jgi:hypothetical protein